MYRLIIKTQAARKLTALTRNIAKLIRSKLDQLASDPFAQNPNVKKLRDHPRYRLRVGDWRIIYTIEKDQLIVVVLKIASRGDIYR